MSVGAPELLVDAEAAVDTVVVPGEIAARSPLQLFWRRFRGDNVALVALAVIALPGLGAARVLARTSFQESR